MKIEILIVMLLSNITIIAQKKSVYTFGKISQEEHEMKIYPKDTTANSVFLFENGETKFYDGSHGITIKTKYYAKVKILIKKGLTRLQ